MRGSVGLRSLTHAPLNVRQESSHGHALLLMSWEVFKYHGLFSTCGISANKFFTFITTLEAHYGDNPYHCSIHAADVLVNTHLFLTKYAFRSRMQMHAISIARHAETRNRVCPGVPGISLCNA